MPRLKRTKTAAPKAAKSKKFSKAAAEKLGWVFVGDAPERVFSVHETQGVVRSTPADLRAEKYFSPSQRIEEQAEDLETLLERISLYEAERASRE
jgi:hypothetical protein